MGLEDSDNHIDKEPDGVIIYSNGLNQDSSYVSASQLDLSKPCDFINLDPQPDDTLDKSAETKHYVIKECNSEKSVEVTIPSFSTEINLSKENGTHEVRKSPNDVMKTRVCGKKTTRSAVGNCKTKCTIPQPFALSTEKRATYGTRPYGAEFDSLTIGDRPSNVSLQHQASAKQNPVNISPIF